MNQINTLQDAIDYAQYCRVNNYILPGQEIAKMLYAAFFELENRVKNLEDQLKTARSELDEIKCKTALHEKKPKKGNPVNTPYPEIPSEVSCKS